MEKLHLLAILLIVFSSNLDSLGVGISYGTRKVSIPFTSNLLIAVIGGLGTLLSILAGGIISVLLKPEFAKYLGSAIIIVAGIWIIINEILKPNNNKLSEEQQRLAKIDTPKHSFFNRLFKILENPFIADVDFSGHISIREGLLLGLALTLNNLANGIGAGMIGLSPVLTALFAALFSFLSIWAGIKIGYGYASRWLGDLAGPISGLILIVIGIYELFP